MTKLIKFIIVLSNAFQTANIISQIYGLPKEKREGLREVKRNFLYVDNDTFTQYVDRYLSGQDNGKFEGNSAASKRIVSRMKEVVKESAGK